MSDSSVQVQVRNAVQTGALATRARLGDYLALLKPRVMSLVAFTGLVGLLVAPVRLAPADTLLALMCIALGAGAAGALNMWYERDVDARMRRTLNRPLPAGRLAPGEALVFGVTAAFLSVAVMAWWINPVAASLLALTILFYLLVYTVWLKRRTPQNIVIGGAAGALPPVIGWAAATGEVGLASLTLFAVTFVWTPPHFWALALNRADDYARAGIPMLPVVAGADETRRHILVYALALLPVSLGPWFAGLGGSVYAITATLLGLGFVALAIRLWRRRSARAAWRMFAYSIPYLFLLFATLAAERVLAWGN